MHCKSTAARSGVQVTVLTPNGSSSNRREILMSWTGLMISISRSLIEFPAL